MQDPVFHVLHHPLDPSEYTAGPRKGEGGGIPKRGCSGVLTEILEEEEVAARSDMEIWVVLEPSGHVCMAA